MSARRAPAAPSGVVVAASVKLDVAAVQSWQPAQVAAVFAGIAAVLAAGQTDNDRARAAQGGGA